MPVLKELNLERVQTLSNQMNKITEKLKTNLDLSDELEASSNDVIDYVSKSIEEVPEQLPTENYVDLINLNNLLEDFSYIRVTLRDNSENGKKILKVLSTEILASDPETLSEMVASYSDLNRSLTDTMKLYLQTYKDISSIILNLEKVKQGLSKTENNLNINTFGADKEEVSSVIKSTAEIIEKIRQNARTHTEEPV